LPIILDTRETLKADIKQKQVRVDEIDAEITHLLNGAPLGLCNEWRISNQMQHRKEFLVPAKSYPVLRITKSKEQTAS
jgi:hypothetical protein